MSSIPPLFGRVPNALSSQVMRQTIAGTSQSLLQAQISLATGKRVNRPSDDPIAASLIGVLDRSLETAEQRGRNLDHAAAVMGTLDQSLGELNEAALQAKEVAASQIGVGSDSDTRKSQAIVVSSLIDSVYSSLNRSFAGLHLFSGERTSPAPIQAFHGGYRYVGAGSGLRTDLGPGIDVPITIGADEAVGALSARVRGDVDLNPRAWDGTLVSDLRGPAGEGAALGSIEIRINTGTPPETRVTVDLSGAESLGDVRRSIESAIRDAAPGTLGGAFPNALGYSNDALQISSITPGHSIVFEDGSAGSTASALGLAGFTYTDAATVNPAPSGSLNPRLNDRTLLGLFNPGSPLSFGDIVIRNGGRQGTVTTHAAMTVGELKEAVARLDLGVRLEIDPSGNSLNLVNEVSGFRMSVEESGGLAATALGLRSLSGTTRLADFNDGRGVTIADGAVDPISGLPDPSRNTDFEVTLSDGSTFTVDLSPADTADVNAVIAKINADAAAAGFGGVFTAALASSGNGIELQDTSGGAGAMSVRTLNGHAAEDLGLLDGTFTPGPTGVLRSTDRATVRVDSMLSALIELRDALNANDELGITFAGERVEAGLDRATVARGTVGARAARVDDARNRLEDAKVLDQSVKSSLQDLDYVEATTRFALLQAQLQAGYQATAAVGQLSLLNFLG